jgi:hypothetical protein
MSEKKQRFELDYQTDGHGQIAVVLTTPTRDVWFGFLVGDGHDALIDALNNKWCMLAEARHCFHFDTTEGLGQLIGRGPGPNAKIGPPCPVVGVPTFATLDPVTKAAAAAFAAAEWKR